MTNLKCERDLAAMVVSDGGVFVILMVAEQWAGRLGLTTPWVVEVDGAII